MYVVVYSLDMRTAFFTLGITLIALLAFMVMLVINFVVGPVLGTLVGLCCFVVWFITDDIDINHELSRNGQGECYLYTNGVITTNEDDDCFVGIYCGSNELFIDKR